MSRRRWGRWLVLRSMKRRQLLEMGHASKGVVGSGRCLVRRAWETALHILLLVFFSLRLPLFDQSCDILTVCERSTFYHVHLLLEEHSLCPHSSGFEQMAESKMCPYSFLLQIWDQIVYVEAEK